MPSWKDLPQLMGPRVVDSDRGLASTFVRFDNGVYLRVEPVPRNPDLMLRFALLRGADGTTLTPPLSEAAGYLRGGWGYRFTKVVGLSLRERRRHPEDSEGLDGVRLALAATSARLFIAAAAHPEKLPATAPMWNARAEFTVVGTQRGWTQPLDYTEAVPRISAAIDTIGTFLSDSIDRSRISP